MMFNKVMFSLPIFAAAVLLSEGSAATTSSLRRGGDNNNNNNNRRQLGLISSSSADDSSPDEEEMMNSSQDLPVVISAPQEDEDHSHDPAEDSAVVIIAPPDGFSQSASDEDTTDPGFGCQPVHDIICNQSILSTLCELLFTTYPVVGETISKGEWTVFAPDNTAFENIGSSLLELSNKKISRIVYFHASSEGIYFPWDLQCTEKMLMASGDYSRTSCEKNDDGVDELYQKGNGNYKLDLIPKLELPSLRACNGIVHILDAVMLPVYGSTSEAVESEEEEEKDSNDSPSNDMAMQDMADGDIMANGDMVSNETDVSASMDDSSSTDGSSQDIIAVEWSSADMASNETDVSASGDENMA